MYEFYSDNHDDCANLYPLDSMLSHHQNYNFKVVCWDCIQFKSAHVSLELYSIGAGDHSCSKDVLICSYLNGRSRTSHYYYYIGPAHRKMQQCPSLSMNVRCENLKPGSVCTGWHSKTEQHFWKLELASIFNRNVRSFERTV